MFHHLFVLLAQTDAGTFLLCAVLIAVGFWLMNWLQSPSTPAPPREPTRAELIAQAKRELADQLQLAKLHRDPLEREAFAAGAEARFRNAISHISGN